MARPLSGSNPSATPSHSSNPDSSATPDKPSASHAQASPIDSSSSPSQTTPVSSSAPNLASPNSATQAPVFRTDSEVLRFVADHMDTGLPSEHADLLDRANDIIVRRRNTNAARPFEYVGNNPGVRSIISRLQNAAALGHIPNPYPLSTDPLNLAAWASTAKQTEVTFVARQFPDLQNALIPYWNKGIID